MTTEDPVIGLLSINYNYKEYGIWNAANRTVSLCVRGTVEDMLDNILDFSVDDDIRRLVDKGVYGDLETLDADGNVPVRDVVWDSVMELIRERLKE